MGHQMQDLGDFRFELAGFGKGTHEQGLGYTVLPCWWGLRPPFSTARARLIRCPGKNSTAALRRPCCDEEHRRDSMLQDGNAEVPGGG
jgi:hypothetical protein